VDASWLTLTTCFLVATIACTRLSLSTHWSYDE